MASFLRRCVRRSSLRTLSASRSFLAYSRGVGQAGQGREVTCTSRLLARGAMSPAGVRSTMAKESKAEQISGKI